MPTYRRFLTAALALTLAISSLPSVSAQTAVDARITCIPVQQFAQDRTQLECRMRTDEIPQFLVAEVTFPFQVTELIKVSSIYSASLGILYPEAVENNTLFLAAMDWGDRDNSPRMQAVPFDGVSFLLETNQSMKDVKDAMETGQVVISLLTPNAGAPLSPVFQTLSVDQLVLFDGSLILESFTQYVSPGVLQFLRLGASCYEETPQNCLANIIQNL